MTVLRLVGDPEPRDPKDAAGAPPTGESPTRGETATTAPRTSQDWSQIGSCRGMSVDIFFATMADEIEAAKAICRRCPVRLPCLDEAVRNPSVRGVWGGASDNDRLSMRRRG